MGAPTPWREQHLLAIATHIHSLTLVLPAGRARYDCLPRDAKDQGGCCPWRGDHLCRQCEYAALQSSRAHSRTSHLTRLVHCLTLTLHSLLFQDPNNAITLESTTTGGGSAGLPPPSRQDHLKEIKHMQEAAAQRHKGGDSYVSNSQADVVQPQRSWNR